MTESRKCDDPCGIKDGPEAPDKGADMLLSKMKLVFDNLPYDSWVKDEAGRYLAVNKTFSDAVGLSESEIAGKCDEDIFDAAEAVRNQEMEAACLLGKRQMRFEVERDDGCWSEIILNPLISETGDAAGIAGLSRDITDKKQAESAKEIYEARLQQVQQIAGLGSWEHEKDSTAIWASRQFMKIFGFEETEGSMLEVSKIRKAILKEDRLKRDVAFRLLMEKDRNYDVEFRIKRPEDGAERHIRSCAVMAKDAAGQPHKALGVIQDITDRKAKEEQISYMNDHDLLTGVFNRSFFEREIRRCDRAKGLPLSMIMVDVNGLKLTNDMFGHAEGDRLLISVGRMLAGCCPPGGTVSRIGGDEFCLLLPRTGSDAAKAISIHITRMCEAAEKNRCGERATPSVSAGYATKRDMSESICDVMNEAEAFMYKRKLLESKSLRSSVLSSIRTTLFEKSHETEEHAERLVELSLLIGTEMGLADTHMQDLSLLAALHDIGKMSVDEYILCKPGKLTEQEWAEIRRHPEVGYRIAKSSPELMSIADYILCHHERWDGTGYPQGLKSRNIPLLSRILAVADAYDAMTQDRSYRKAAPGEEAIGEIIRHAGTQFDPDVAIVFIKTMQKKLS